MADSRNEILRLLALGKAINEARRKAVSANFGPSLRGDHDSENIELAKAVEEIFANNGWRAPLPSNPDFSNTSDDNWYPANGGTEEPFVSRSGHRLLYCFQPSSGKHAYLDLNTDIILSDDEARQYMAIY